MPLLLLFAPLLLLGAPLCISLRRCFRPLMFRAFFPDLAKEIREIERSYESEREIEREPSQHTAHDSRAAVSSGVNARGGFFAEVTVTYRHMPLHAVTNHDHDQPLQAAPDHNDLGKSRLRLGDIAMIESRWS